MKIDRSKLRKAQSELPLNCQQLIQKLKEADNDETTEILKGIQTWHFGKCELFHWIDILDKFDTVLANVSKHAEGTEWILVYDQLHLKDKEQAKKYKESISHILKFTGLLVEHSYARHIYSSMEHLIALLSASDMEVVLCVLNVLYIFSKRSNFISRLPVEQRKVLHQRLYCLAESWGGVENGFGLAHCSKDIPPEQFPETASNVYFEFYSDSKKGEERLQDSSNLDSDSGGFNVVYLENVHEISESPGEIMERVLRKHRIPEDKKIKLFSRIRLAKHFHVYNKRIKCLQARLQAISILVYSTSSQENTVNQLLYPGFVEEIVDAIRLNDSHSRYADISSASLRTMTAIIHLERNSRLNSIVEATGANSYHGFLPTLVRNCIQAMTDAKVPLYSHGFATALFSFLYHLASYESGGEALVSCGLMESLLKVIEWPGEEDCITFVTRAVRVVDLITNLDMAGFQNHDGLNTILNRLEREIKVCQPLHGPILSSDTTIADSPTNSCSSNEAMETSPPAAIMTTTPQDTNTAGTSGATVTSMETDTTGSAATSTSIVEGHCNAMDVDDGKLSGVTTATMAHDVTKLNNTQIIPQRAALLKSILNFLKKAILDPSFSDSVRTVMDGSLPTSLKYIISNVEYYGPALYLLATDVVTVYIFHEPSLLSSLQDKDLTGVVLKSLVVKDIPATREVLSFLPNILSALCLNNRGLQAFMACKPFDKLFKVLLSPDYLPAMRRRRNSDTTGDTASSLGTAMDELMRHQPMLKQDAMKAIIKLLQEVCDIGCDPKVTCIKASKIDANPVVNTQDDEPVSDEEYDEDRLPVRKPKEKTAEDTCSESSPDKKRFVPLTDYILNVVKFVDAILSNNSTDDHCREFVRQKGLEPLIKILSLPNLPLDFASSPACQAIGTVTRQILVLCQEHELLQKGLHYLTETLKALEPLDNSLTKTGQSLLLQEVIRSPKPFTAMKYYQQTPLIHAMSCTQSYVNMFTYICRAGQNDVRTVCINHWGAEPNIETLKKLCQLYSALVWESSVLLVLCTQERLPDGCDALKQDVQKLSDLLEADPESSVDDSSSNGEPNSSSGSDKNKNKLSAKLKLLKQLLAASSKLGRALAEFFSLLVRLAVGSGQRQRRLHQLVAPSMPTLPARMIASQLAKLLTHGLSWQDPEQCVVPRLNLIFYVCSLGFVHPMLFDDRKNPYYLMLQELVTSGGHRALFDRFRWVIGREIERQCSQVAPINDQLSESTEEFVSAWLSLMEKLVNPKLILDSPHYLPSNDTTTSAGTTGANSFQPKMFLMSTQKSAFNAVMRLWDCEQLNYGAHMKQSVLSILCHIIQGEKIVKGNVIKGEITDTPSSNTQNNSAAEPPDVNEEHLQQLVDMGFTRQQARNALLNTDTIEQATEYVLTQAPGHVVGNQQLGISYDMSEEDQMMQAIALSLGESLPMSVDQPPSTTSTSTKGAEKSEPEKKNKDDDNETLDSSVIDHFAANMLPGCLNAVTEIADAVYKACDLIVAISARNGKEWRDKVIGEILSKIHDSGLVLYDLYSGVDWKRDNAVKIVAEFGEKPEASLLKSMLHLLSLVLEEMKSPCALLVSQSGILGLLIKLLRVSEKCLRDVKASGTHPTTPSWMTPLLILFDLYERSVDAHVRKIEHDKCTGSVWKWFDDRSGRWHNYSNGNNNTIDKAYRAGETLIRFTAGRRRYVVHFDIMIQVNEDSSNRRPIMLEVTTKPRTMVGTPAAGTNAPSLAGVAGTTGAGLAGTTGAGLAGTTGAGVAGTTGAGVAGTTGAGLAGTTGAGLAGTTGAGLAGTTGAGVAGTTGAGVGDVASAGVTNPATGASVPVVGAAVSGSTGAGNCVTGGAIDTDHGIGGDSSSDKENSEAKKNEASSDSTKLASGEQTTGDEIETYSLIHLEDEQKECLIRSCVSLIAIPIESGALNSVVRICLRLTRDPRLAQVFVNADGPHHLLELRRSSTFDGFTVLITLLLRHVIEDPDTLRHTMEKVIRSAAVSGIGSRNSGVGSNSIGTKEINYILRVLSPAAIRNPTLFKELLVKSIKYSLPSQIRRGGPPGNEITIPPNQAVLVSTIPLEKPPKMPKVSDSVRSVVYELLNALCRDTEQYKISKEASDESNDEPLAESQSSQSPSQVGRALGELGDLLDGRPTPSLVRHLTGESLPSEDIEDMIIDSDTSSSQMSSKENKQKQRENEKKEDFENDSKPLLNKNSILNILGELVKSYSGVAQLIAEFEVHTSESAAKTQMPILAFIMDNLLPNDQGKGSSDVSHRARLLLTVLAACNHSPDAQAILVNELKEALARALTMRESAAKHTRLQALFQLIQGIIESGSGAHQQITNTTTSNQQQNNTVKLFVKKGVISDLARVSQSLDLSSPNTVTTINGLLKPLEKLSNFVNLPVPSASATSDKKPAVLGVATNHITGETTIQRQPTGLADSIRRAENQSRNSAEIRSSANRNLGTISGGLHIEGRAVRREPEDSFMIGSEEGESEAVSTAGDSTNVTERADTDSERVNETSDYMFSDRSLGDGVVIEIRRDQHNDDRVDISSDPESLRNINVDLEIHEDDVDEDDVDEDDVDDDDVDDDDVEDDDDEEEHRSDGEDDDDLDGDDHIDDTTESNGVTAAGTATTAGGGGGGTGGGASAGGGNDGDGMVVGSYNGVIMLEDEGEESHDDEDDDDDDDEDDEDDVDEDGSELEVNEQGIGNHGLDDGNESGYLYLHSDEPRQGSISRLIREHANHGAILSTTSLRRNFFGLRSNPSSITTPLFDFSIEHPMLQRQQSIERPTTTAAATAASATGRGPRVRLVRSDRNRRGHTTHVHVHYAHPQDITRLGRHLFLLDDDLSLTPRIGGHRGLVDEDFTDIFSEGTPSSNLLSDISSALYLWTQESQILDGGSVHHCIASIKKDVLPEMEKALEAQIEEMRKSEREKIEEEEAMVAEMLKKEKEKKEEEQEDKSTNTDEKNESVGVQTNIEPMQLEAGITATTTTTTTGTTDQTSADSANVTTENGTGMETTTTDVPSALTSDGIGNDGTTTVSVPSSNPDQRIAVPTTTSTTTGAPMHQLVGGQPETTISNDAISGTPTFASLVHAAAAAAAAAATTAATSSQSMFVTPNLSDTPPCPNAPQRILQPQEPLLLTPPRTDPETPYESMETGETATSQAQQSSVDVTENIPVRSLVQSLLAPETPPAVASTSGEAVRPATIDGVQIPEGVDPSFLEALPEAIRREVLAEQLALRPSIATTAAAAAAAAAASGSNASESGMLNVSPEFLAALPPDVQDEVLQQQRLEQERQRLTSNPPEEPVDPATFLRNLPASLRQQVLTDMDDSQFSVLPEDLSSQAQILRREFEARQTRTHDRYSLSDSHDAASAISALLRRSGMPRRVGRIGRGGGLQFSRLLPCTSGWGRGPGMASTTLFGKDKKSTMTGRQVLDGEALVCLLILLFLDEPRLNVNRLHRVLRNFCYHEETRLWVIQALIAILRRTSGQNVDGSCVQVSSLQHDRGKGPGKKSEVVKSTSKSLDDQLGDGGSKVGAADMVTSNVHTSWLNMSVDAALGCRTRIFNVQKTGKSTSDKSSTNVCINPQAASFVCKHIVDALAYLAKNFPDSFTPIHAKKEESCSEVTEDAATSQNDSEFWNTLVRLDGTLAGKKGKGSSKNALSSFTRSRDFNTAPIGYLMTLLSHPVIRKNSALMDSLLRLLSVVSASLPDMPEHKDTANEDGNANEAPSTGTTPQPTGVGAMTRARTPESVTSSLVVEASPPGIDVATELDSVGSGPSDLLTQREVNEPMDVEIPVHLTSSVEDEPSLSIIGSPQTLSVIEDDDTSSVVMAPQLRLAVEVLTSGACSEDGLEDATTLLLQVSRLNADTRDAVLSLLLMGVRQLGRVLQGHISRLLEELRKYNATHGTISPNEQTHKEPLQQVLAFQRLNRPPTQSSQTQRLFEQRINVGTGTRGGLRRRNPGQQARHIRSVTYDLHLPAMASLTEKTSSQNLFLRCLKVILQLRVAARKAAVALKKQDEKKREKAEKDAAQKNTSTDGNSSGVTDKPVESGGSNEGAGPSQEGGQNSDKKTSVLPHLSGQLTLDELWETLSECLSELARTSDRNAVLVLQPAVEAFFLVHGTEKEESGSNVPLSRGRSMEIARLASIRSIDDMPASPEPPSPGGSLSPTLPPSYLADLPVDQQTFLRFAEMHQTVLNHILRQSTTHLADGPFAVLVDHTRFLDFDVKRRYFRQELEGLNEGAMRRDDLSMHVRREHVFEDSYRELHRRSPEEMKSRLYVVFEGEEGQDAGGLLREWFIIMSREMFNPNYALFRVSPGDRVTYLPNPSSHCNSNHLSYFKFVGRVVAKAIYDNKLLDAYFTRSFYKHILGKPVKVSDMEAEDYSFYQGLVYLLEHEIDGIDVELTFSTEIEEFGVSEVRDLKANGRNIPVTEDNKKEYVKLICQERMTGSIRKQIESFLEGFYEIIPKRLISIFDEQELELLISGLPNIDLDDLKANTEYHKYNENSLQIQWLWRALRSFDQADRAKFLQFVTGTSKVPLQGFAALEGMNGLQKFQIHRDDRSTDRLPAAHTCFNQLDLPAYETYDKLRSVLLKTIHECPEGFGLA